MVKRVSESAKSPNREELFQMAVQASQTNKPGARIMFRKILSDDPRNIRVMMWLAKIAPNRDERRKWFEAILDVDPENEQVLQAIEKMEHQDTAGRNRLLLRLGVGTYVTVVLLIAAVVLLSTAAQPAI